MKKNQKHDKKKKTKPTAQKENFKKFIGMTVTNLAATDIPAGTKGIIIDLDSANDPIVLFNGYPRRALWHWHWLEEFKTSY